MKVYRPTSNTEMIQFFSSHLASRLEEAVNGRANIPHPRIDPSGYVSGMMRNFKKLPHLPKGGATTGTGFELVLLSALLGAGVSESRISIHEHVSKKWRIEVDIHICGHPPVSIMSKTSLRERFKQADRDALGISYNDNRGHWGDVYLLFWSEHPMTDTKAKSLEQARKVQDQFISQAKVLTIEDAVSMKELFGRILMGE